MLVSELAVRHLHQLGRGYIAPLNVDRPLFDELQRKLAVGINELAPYLKRWEKFSGDYSYPIPSPFPDVSPVWQHYAAENAGRGVGGGLRFWGNNPYGDLHREFCLFLAEELKHELNEEGCNSDYVKPVGEGCRV